MTWERYHILSNICLSVAKHCQPSDIGCYNPYDLPAIFNALNVTNIRCIISWTLRVQLFNWLLHLLNALILASLTLKQVFSIEWFLWSDVFLDYKYADKWNKNALRVLFVSTVDVRFKTPANFYFLRSKSVWEILYGLFDATAFRRLFNPLPTKIIEPIRLVFPSLPGRCTVSIPITFWRRFTKPRANLTDI